MNRLDFIKLVADFKVGSLKGAGFKPVKPGNFDVARHWKIVDAWLTEMEDYLHAAKVARHSSMELAQSYLKGYASTWWKTMGQEEGKTHGVVTPLWVKCEDETHIPKSGNLESFGTLEILELDCRGQNTLPWGVVYAVGKVLKFRCRKWPPMSHLDICSTSYGRKKSQESNWQIWLPTTKSRESTRPRCVQVECDTPLESSWGELQICFRPHPNRSSELGVMSSQSPGSPIRDNFGTPPWESWD